MDPPTPFESALIRIEELRRFAANRKHSEYGLCAKCRHMAIRVHARGAMDTKIAWCEILPDARGRGLLRLNADFPVKDCGRFWPAGAPTLDEMLAQAKLIDLRTFTDTAYR